MVRSFFPRCCILTRSRFRFTLPFYFLLRDTSAANDRIIMSSPDGPSQRGHFAVVASCFVSSNNATSSGDAESNGKCSPRHKVQRASRFHLDNSSQVAPRLPLSCIRLIAVCVLAITEVVRRGMCATASVQDEITNWKGCCFVSFMFFYIF